MIKTVDEILHFWFGDLDDELASAEKSALMYQADPQHDLLIRTLFLPTYEVAREGHLEQWQTNARGSLALIILLDQMPRNMFRGNEQAFATDAQALAYCLDGIEHGYDDSLALAARVLYYHPLEHCEQLAIQNLSVSKFTELLDKYPQQPHQQLVQNSLHWANVHHDIIARFGRFPHRNNALSRESTAAELDYLTSASSFGQ